MAELRAPPPWTRWCQQHAFPRLTGPWCKGHVRNKLGQNVQGLMVAACKPQRRIRAKSWDHQPENPEWHPTVEMLVRRCQQQQTKKEERGPQEKLCGNAEDDGIHGEGHANITSLSQP